jgi:Leucine-rich repeat (LRR) protein
MAPNLILLEKTAPIWQKLDLKDLDKEARVKTMVKTSILSCMGRELYLAGLGLTYPDMVEIFKALVCMSPLIENGLTRLNLSKNNLVELPDTVGKFINLKALKLNENCLINLPISFSALTQLKELDLSNNQLTAVPPPLANLVALQTLNLAYNKLTSLPNWLQALPELKKLTIYTEEHWESLGSWLADFAPLQVTNLPLWRRWLDKEEIRAFISQYSAENK